MCGVPGVRRLTEPLVTVYMPSYNHARFLPAALESVSRQTFGDFEFIVVDDCSSDESVAIIERWLTEQPFPCTFVKHAENRGVCRTLNEILSKARGKYWAGVASDDSWSPEFLERFVCRVEQLPEDVAVLYGDVEVIDDQGRVSPELYIGRFLQSGAPPEGRVFDDLWKLNFVPAAATMCRTDCLRDVGGYDEGLWYEDWDLWLRLADRYSFAFQPGVHAQRRIAGTSMTRTPIWSRRMAESRRRIRLGWFAKLAGSHEAPEDTLYWPNGAEDLYSIGDPRAVRFASRKWHFERSLRSLLLLSCIRTGLPYSGYERLLKWTRTLRGITEGR